MKSILRLVVLALLCTNGAFSQQVSWCRHLLLQGNLLSARSPSATRTATSGIETDLTMVDDNPPSGKSWHVPDTTDLQEPESRLVTITTHGGEQYTGSLLYAGDSALVLWQSNTPYISSNLELFAKSVAIGRIDIITVVKDGHFWSQVASGAGGGFLLGTVGGFAVATFVDSTKFLTNLGFGLVMGLVIAIPGAIIYGIKGAIEGIDDKYAINGDGAAYRAILMTLRQRAIYPARPPAELESFMR